MGIEVALVLGAVLLPELYRYRNILCHGLILIVTSLYLDCLILQGLLDELGVFVLALILPAADIEELLIVALSLAFLSLVFLAEVTTARLVTRECIVSHKFAHREEVTQMDGLVEFDIPRESTLMTPSIRLEKS